MCEAMLSKLREGNATYAVMPSHELGLIVWCLERVLLFLLQWRGMIKGEGRVVKDVGMRGIDQ
jgi:hypothetical protein